MCDIVWPLVAQHVQPLHKFKIEGHAAQTLTLFVQENAVAVDRQTLWAAFAMTAREQPVQDLGPQP